jgi:pimeloyl-ACP methyl ester carboxylesterase
LRVLADRPHWATVRRRTSSGFGVSSTDVAGRPVRSYAMGAQTGLPVVVMVPGLGASGYLFRWARAMAKWTRVSVLDLPGWRFSRARASEPTVAGVAAATEGWLRKRDLQNVVLIGHSTGAQAVLRTALAVPDRLTGLVLAGPTFDPAARHRGAVVRRAACTVLHEVPAELPAVLPSYLHSGGWPLLRMLLSALPDQMESLLPQLRTPALFITRQT